MDQLGSSPENLAGMAAKPQLRCCPMMFWDSEKTGHQGLLLRAFLAEAALSALF